LPETKPLSSGIAERIIQVSTLINRGTLAG
jgi:hypothetical protein